jgi:hypothetical protein
VASVPTTFIVPRIENADEVALACNGWLLSRRKMESVPFAFPVTMSWRLWLAMVPPTILAGAREVTETDRSCTPATVMSVMFASNLMTRGHGPPPESGSQLTCCTTAVPRWTGMPEVTPAPLAVPSVGPSEKISAAGGTADTSGHVESFST